MHGNQEVHDPRAPADRGAPEGNFPNPGMDGVGRATLCEPRNHPRTLHRLRHIHNRQLLTAAYEACSLSIPPWKTHAQGSAALTVMPWRAAGDSYAAGADGSGCGVGPQETQTLWVSALTATAHSVFLSGGASMGPPLLTASRCERRPRLERKFSKNLGGLIQKPGSSGFGLLTETDGEVRFSLLATRYRSTEKSQNVVDVVR